MFVRECSSDGEGLRAKKSSEFEAVGDWGWGVSAAAAFQSMAASQPTSPPGLSLPRPHHMAFFLFLELLKLTPAPGPLH